MSAESLPSAAASTTGGPQDGSPWSEPRPSASPIHWREGPSSKRSQAQLGDSFPVYAMGFAGTIVAGGLFSWVVAAFAFLFSSPPGRIGGGELIVFLIFGFRVGAFFAAAAAVCVFPIVGLNQWLGDLYPWRTLFAAVAGGWSGIAAAQYVLQRMLVTGNADWELVPLQLGAAVMGHMSAGFAARQAHRWQLATFAWRDPSSRSQLTLRQLLGITAGVAVLAATVGTLELTRAAVIGIGCCVAAQLVMIAGYFAVGTVKSRRRRRV